MLSLISREECCLVHESEFWKRWEKSESMNQEDREKLAKVYNQLYLNHDSVKCAR